jgi:hypothetical protein
MERCYGRRPDLGKNARELFQGGVNYNGTKRDGYVIEKRCEKKVSSGKLCEKCKDICINDRDPKTCAGNLGVAWYGLVTEPITSKYMFGGSEWLKDAAAYGISQEGLEKGIAAHNDAVKGLNGVPPLPDMSAMVKKEVTDPPPKKTKAKKAVVEPVSVEQEAKLDKKPKNIKLVASLTPMDVRKALNQPDVAEVPLVVAPPPPAKEKTVRKKKTVAAPSPDPIVPIAILSEEKPVDVEDVETIDVIVKFVEGKDWYYDSRNHKRKLYDPKTGKYVGRYESETNTINRSITDSDAE